MKSFSELADYFQQRHLPAEKDLPTPAEIRRLWKRMEVITNLPESEEQPRVVAIFHQITEWTEEEQTQLYRMMYNAFDHCRIYK